MTQIRWRRILALAAVLATLALTSPAWSFDAGELLGPAPDWGSVLARNTKTLSVEAGLAHYGSHVPGDGIQGWNLGARIGWLPFGALKFERFPLINGAFEIGLEPVFQRFRNKNQNFAGLLAQIRYYFLDFSYGPLVPWISGAIGPGGSDIHLGKEGGTNYLTGPFLASVHGEIGECYFISAHQSVYLGLQGQHFSNGSLNGPNRNFSLNTPWGGVLGYSWFFK
jgi:hypothetical protein